MHTLCIGFVLGMHLMIPLLPVCLCTVWWTSFQDRNCVPSTPKDDATSLSKLGAPRTCLFYHFLQRPSNENACSVEFCFHNLAHLSSPILSIIDVLHMHEA